MCLDRAYADVMICTDVVYVVRSNDSREAPGVVFYPCGLVQAILVVMEAAAHFEERQVYSLVYFVAPHRAGDPKPFSINQVPCWRYGISRRE